MLMHIQTFGQSCPCLQWVNICCVFVGDISFEIKTEADSNDITQYQHDDMPSTGMIVFIMSVFCVPRLMPYLLHHHIIRPITVFCGTDLLYQTQHEIQITAGSGSMNESLTDTVGCLCSIAVCFVFHCFIMYIYAFALFDKNQPWLSG